jgi:hypothetical protein
MFIVEPSEYVPTATNCCVEPNPPKVGEAGVIATEDNVAFAVVVVVEEGAADVETILIWFVRVTGMPPAKLILKLRFPKAAELEAVSVICNWYTVGPKLPGIILSGPLFEKVSSVVLAIEDVAVTVIV